MHGGISPDLKKYSDITKYDRFKEPPLEGIMCDLLWADPVEDGKEKDTDYEDNLERDCSYVFGNKPVETILKKNGLISIVRAH